MVEYSTNKWELGFTEQETTIYGLSQVEYEEIESSNPNLIYKLNLMMDRDLETRSRSLYTYFDFLGDVGGLYGIFVQLAQLLLFILSFFSPDSMLQFVA